jgi:hypothetical protein
MDMDRKQMLRTAKKLGAEMINVGVDYGMDSPEYLAARARYDEAMSAWIRATEQAKAAR